MHKRLIGRKLNGEHIINQNYDKLKSIFGLDLISPFVCPL